MVELVYKFHGKSTASVLTGESIAKVPFKLFMGSNAYKHTHIYILHTHINRYQDFYLPLLKQVRAG